MVTGAVNASTAPVTIARLVGAPAAIAAFISPVTCDFTAVPHGSSRSYALAMTDSIDVVPEGAPPGMSASVAYTIVPSAPLALPPLAVSADSKAVQSPCDSVPAAARVTTACSADITATLRSKDASSCSRFVIGDVSLRRMSVATRDWRSASSARYAGSDVSPASASTAVTCSGVVAVFSRASSDGGLIDASASLGSSPYSDTYASPLAALASAALQYSPSASPAP